MNAEFEKAKLAINNSKLYLTRMLESVRVTILSNFDI